MRCTYTTSIATGPCAPSRQRCRVFCFCLSAYLCSFRPVSVFFFLSGAGAGRGGEGRREFEDVSMYAQASRSLRYFFFVSFFLLPPLSLSASELRKKEERCRPVSLLSSFSSGLSFLLRFCTCLPVFVLPVCSLCLLLTGGNLELADLRPDIEMVGSGYEETPGIRKKVKHGDTLHLGTRCRPLSTQALSLKAPTTTTTTPAPPCLHVYLHRRDSVRARTSHDG